MDAQNNRDDKIVGAMFLSVFKFILPLSLLVLNVGCFSSSSAPASLTFRSAQDSREYSQKFNRAFFSQAPSGEYDAILIEDGIVPSKGKPGAPIAASVSAPLAQTMHIRVLWKPLSGNRPDAPSATNAVIDWYVRANDPSGRSDHLHYRGAGFVAVYDSDDEAEFVIRSAQLDLASSSGRLQDPLGSSIINGSFKARKNSGQVATAMESFREMPSPIQLPVPGSHDGPPPRTQTGP